MYNFETTQKFQSKLFPDVSFSVRKMTEATRVQFRLQMADAKDRLLEEVTEANQLRLVPEESRDLQALAARDQAIELIMNREIKPGWVKWGLVSVEGFAIDGIPATPETIDQGPNELYAEIVSTIQLASEMSEEEIKNFASPSISGTQVECENRNTTAESASAPDTSAPETVASTSPSL